MQLLILFYCFLFGSTALYGAVSDKERELFLTPGGKYTSEDIAANGNMTRAQKYKNSSQSSSCEATARDTVCPITASKASPEYAWIIGGKTYQFCNPACIDAFLTLAKTAPEKIQEPEYYVK